jgi:hypothetical protein
VADDPLTAPTKLERRRRHIFWSGTLSTQQPEHARILPAEVQLLNFLDSEAESAHQSINLEQVLDAAVQYVFLAGLVRSTTGYKAQKLSLQGIKASSTCRSFPVRDLKNFHWRLT